MQQPMVVILGVYKVPLTQDLFREAMEVKFAGLDLSAEERRDAEEAVRRELSSVVLLDVLVSNPDERFDVGDFGQPDSDQAPYDEAYLSLDGKSVISRCTAPASDSLRIAFFLHFFDPTKPLTTSYGLIPVPAIQEMPEHLQRIVPYTPVE